MVTLVDTSPMKNLSFHFQAKIQLKSPPPKAKTNNNNMVDTSFLTWSDEKRRPPSSLVNIVKKNDIRKYFPIVKQSLIELKRSIGQRSTKLKNRIRYLFTECLKPEKIK